MSISGSGGGSAGLEQYMTGLTLSETSERPKYAKLLNAPSLHQDTWLQQGARLKVPQSGGYEDGEGFVIDNETNKTQYIAVHQLLKATGDNFNVSSSSKVSFEEDDFLVSSIPLKTIPIKKGNCAYFDVPSKATITAVLYDHSSQNKNEPVDIQTVISQGGLVLENGYGAVEVKYCKNGTVKLIGVQQPTDELVIAFKLTGRQLTNTQRIYIYIHYDTSDTSNKCVVLCNQSTNAAIYHTGIFMFTPTTALKVHTIFEGQDSAILREGQFGIMFLEPGSEQVQWYSGNQQNFEKQYISND